MGLLVILCSERYETGLDLAIRLPPFLDDLQFGHGALRIYKRRIGMK